MAPKKTAETRYWAIRAFVALLLAYIAAGRPIEDRGVLQAEAERLGLFTRPTPRPSTKARRGGPCFHCHRTESALWTQSPDRLRVILNAPPDAYFCNECSKSLTSQYKTYGIWFYCMSDVDQIVVDFPPAVAGNGVAGAITGSCCCCSGRVFAVQGRQVVVSEDHRHLYTGVADPETGIVSFLLCTACERHQGHPCGHGSGKRQTAEADADDVHVVEPSRRRTVTTGKRRRTSTVSSPSSYASDEDYPVLSLSTGMDVDAVDTAAAAAASAAAAITAVPPAAGLAAPLCYDRSVLPPFCPSFLGAPFSAPPAVPRSPSAQLREMLDQAPSEFYDELSAAAAAAAASPMMVPPAHHVASSDPTHLSRCDEVVSVYEQALVQSSLGGDAVAGMGAMSSVLQDEDSALGLNDSSLGQCTHATSQFQNSNLSEFAMPVTAASTPLDVALPLSTGEKTHDGHHLYTSMDKSHLEDDSFFGPAIPARSEEDDFSGGSQPARTASEFLFGASSSWEHGLIDPDAAIWDN